MVGYPNLLNLTTHLILGLFQAVVAQSGCALSPFSVYRPPHSIRTTTRNLALMLQCPVNSSQSIIDCLRQKSATEIAITYPQVMYKELLLFPNGEDLNLLYSKLPVYIIYL